jgi:flavin-dependent dehydrogenase
MPAKNGNKKSLLILASLAAGLLHPAQAAELSTLFTTPQECQIINTNRYKGAEVKRPVVTEAVELPIQQLVQEKVTREYKISGITVSRDGPHTVWINSLAFEDGEELEDKSKVKVVVGDEIKVRITTPDGKHYYATSGETLEVTYLATPER